MNNKHSHMPLIGATQFQSQVKIDPDIAQAMNQGLPHPTGLLIQLLRDMQQLVGIMMKVLASPPEEGSSGK